MLGYKISCLDLPNSILPNSITIEAVQKCVLKLKNDFFFTEEGPSLSRRGISNFLVKKPTKSLVENIKKEMTSLGWRDISSNQEKVQNILFNKENTLCCFYWV